MAVKPGSQVLQEFLATEAGIALNVAYRMSGADLLRAAMVNKAGNPAGEGVMDGARLTLAGGKINFPK